MAELDDQTESLVQQLYEAWSTNADPTSYLNLRDQLLCRRERVDTCIATLKTVITVACPQINETERYFDPKWEELFALAESIESSAEEDDGNPGKRKRGYNEVHRLRNLAVVSALWSPSVVRHYGWNSAAQGCMRLLKTCALRFPDFGKQFCPHLNRVLLDRHCEAILSGHLKTLNEARLQYYRDLNIVVGGGVVLNPEIEELWVTSSNGAVPVDSNGRLLKDLRPYHFHQHLLRRDRYGMLVARGECQDIPAKAHQQSDFSHAPSVYGGFLTHDNGVLASVPEFTFSPMFTPLGVDALLDSFAFSYQAEPLPYGLNDASTITFSSDKAVDLALNPDEVPISDHTFSSDVPEQRHADNDNTPNVSTGTRRNSRRQSQEESVASVARTTRAAQLAASPANPCAQTGTPSSLPERKSTIEDELRNRYHQRLSNYVQRLSDEALPGYDQRRVRSQWLTSDTRWARIWSISGSNSIPPGTATSKADCDILYCSADGILEAAQSGEVFQKPVVIKESFSDAGMHNYERFLSLLEDASNSEEQVEVRCIDIEEPMREALGKFTAYLRSHPGDTDGFWMSTARSVANCHRPLFTMLNRFRLLESVTAGLHDYRSNPASSPLGKAMSVNSNTISFPGAFSGAYLNTAAGSWHRNLSGVKLWVFVPETEVPLGELASLANEENGWLPRGKQRLVVLEENDVLFVPPGLRLVQAWHTPTTCLTEQGMLWDDLSVLSILESMPLGRENQAVQDDRTAQQLFRMINNLDCLITEQPDRFRRSMAHDEFMARFREASQSWLGSCPNGGRTQ
ncbi:hypothetical protein BDW02DRAFT_572889 [Decorospora gaudefroyi]|uniref:JmjC domain-containing protein n=1 Tax=Decorospora gaudefroyi TaxID=184978 RepID=A0A6A5K6S9_9PLEO|nr:hypothetical protein BDW02DRAFT_572889 [Decorospora gaudefroyi]